MHRGLDDLSQECPVYNDGGRWFVHHEAFRVQVPLNLHEAMALYLAVRTMTTRTNKHNPHAASALRHQARALESVADHIAAFIRLSVELMEQSEGRRQDPRYLQVLETLTRAWAEAARSGSGTATSKPGGCMSTPFRPTSSSRTPSARSRMSSGTGSRRVNSAPSKLSALSG